MRIQFKYKNHEGKIEDRDVDVTKLGFDMMNHEESPYGYQPGWFISGFDHSRDRKGEVYRSFYLTHIILDDKLRAGKFNYILATLPQEETK